MERKHLGLVLSVAAFSLAGIAGRASATITIPMVTVGNPGNLNDSTGIGAVGYTFNIGEYDVTVGQYTAFLNAVAKTDTYGLYVSNMGTDFKTLGIKQSGSSGSYSYSVTGSYSQGTDCPIFDVNWGDAARFCNWLSNGQPNIPEGNGSTETGSYTLNGVTSNAALLAITRNANATYVIPTESEWYKAAYYDPTLKNGAGGYWLYPTQSNTLPHNSLSTLATDPNDANFFYSAYTDITNSLTPVGTFAASFSAYGTFDQGGDVFQWNETNINGGIRGFRGGDWYDGPFALESADRDGGLPTAAYDTLGLRVTQVTPAPEPASLGILGLGIVGMLIRRRSVTWV